MKVNAALVENFILNEADESFMLKVKSNYRVAKKKKKETLVTPKKLNPKSIRFVYFQK
jgi:argonaute-like protein implicated in RNA metabolism and viral defense